MHLGVGITKFDGDVPHELVFESDGHDPRYRFYDRRFAVCDMPDRTYKRIGNKTLVNYIVLIMCLTRLPKLIVACGRANAVSQTIISSRAEKE